MNKLIFSKSQGVLGVTALSDRTRMRNVDILIALFPSLLWGAGMYGLRPILYSLSAILTSLLTESLWLLSVKGRVSSAGDLSSPVFTLIAAMLLPPSAPIYIYLITGALCAFTAKTLPFITSLPLSPSALSLSLIVLIFKDGAFSYPPVGFRFITEDFEENAEYAISALIRGSTPTTPWYDMLFGNVPGPFGALSALLILAGGVYLIIRKVSSTKASMAFLIGVGTAAYFLSKLSYAFDTVMYVLLCGQFLFAAFFLVSLPGIRPTDSRLDTILPLLAGALSVYLAMNGILLAVPYAVLAMNLVSSLARFLPPADRVFGKK